MEEAQAEAQTMKALDLYCGAGGMSMGIYRAGFDVTGVDLFPQPDYPFPLIRADALEVSLDGYDAIFASPPCQAYSISTRGFRDDGKVYPDLLGPTRERLLTQDAPWVIENVPGAPMRVDLMLCGSMFGMKVRRHRWFECSWPIAVLTPPCDHSERPVVVSGNNHSGGHTADEIVAAMGMPWTNRAGARQAVPPAYGQLIATQLLSALEAAA